MTSFSQNKRNTKLQNQKPNKSRHLITKSRSDNILTDLSNHSDSSSSSSTTDIDMIKPLQRKSSSRMFSAARNLLKLFSNSSTSKSTSSVDVKLQYHGNQSTRIPLSTPVANKPKNKFESIRIQMIPSGQSLGFTLAGYCPCHIAKLETNSPAANVGLKVGDLIIKINDKNVSRAKCDSIIKIIKGLNGDQILTIDVLRSNKKTALAINSTENTEYTNLNQIRATKYRHHKKISHRKITTRAVAAARKSRSNISKPSAKNVQSIIEQSSTSYMPSPIPHMPPMHSNKKSSVTDSDYKTQSYQSDCDQSLLDAQKDQDFCHMNACEGILNLEEKFIDSMQRGVQHYSRPLRHCMMISPQQHQSLFQNIEKILAISEYQLNQLISHDDSALFDMFNTIGKLYENKLRMSAEAFDIYLAGVEQSFVLLNNFTKCPGSNNFFSKFLLESGEDISMDLKTFLLLPLYYVVSVYKSLQLIKSKTSAVNSDYQSLSNLLENLKSHVQKAEETLNRMGAQNKNPFSEDVNEDSYLSAELVYSGDLKCKSNGKWVEVNAQLFTDRFCFGDNEQQSEILLSNIVEFDFSNRNEFQFSYLAKNSGTKLVSFRANSLHEKLKWKCLLRN